MKWAIEKTTSGSYKLIPTVGLIQDYVLATSTSNTGNGFKLIHGDYVENNSYRDEWFVVRRVINIEFSYDQGFVEAHRVGTESLSTTKNRIEQNLIDEYFNEVAKAFAQECGISFTLKSVSNYTSDADECPNNELSEHCECIGEGQCLLEFYHDPTQNNSESGFSYDVHCKSFARLRNNLITNIPSQTIRITYSGHDLCFYSSPNDHSYDVAGLSDYNNPIICINVLQNNSKDSILTLAHEISHLYGINHHSPQTDQVCIMDTDGFDTTDLIDYSTYWCDECINMIVSNFDKY